MSGPNDDDRVFDASGRDRELSNGARALIAAAREGDAPSSADRERVRRALAVTIAASAGTAGAAGTAAAGAKAAAASTAATAGTGAAAATGGVAAGAAATASVATAGVLTKVAIAVVAIGVGSGALVAVNHYATTQRSDAVHDVPIVQVVAATSDDSSEHSAPNAVRDPAPSSPAAPELGDAPTIAEIAAPVAVATSPRPDGAAHRRATRPAPSAAADPDSLFEETLALHDAIAHTTTPQQRLASVDAHTLRFPSGQLASQRETARSRAVRDLCAAGPDAVAAFLAAHPQSSSADTIRQTCSTASH